jgi:hypothetical protein
MSGRGSSSNLAATRGHSICNVREIHPKQLKVTEQFITQNQILRLPHSPYSPDIAPSNFWLFGHMKKSLDDRTFDEAEQLLEAITEFLDEIHPSELEVVFSHWVERVRWVLESNGDYYHQ